MVMITITRRLLENRSPGDGGGCCERPGDLRSKAHPEPPLTLRSFGTPPGLFAPIPQKGPDCPYTINAATMRPCRADYPASLITWQATCLRWRAHAVFEQPASDNLNGAVEVFETLSLVAFLTTATLGGAS